MSYLQSIFSCTHQLTSLGMALSPYARLDLDGSYRGSRAETRGVAIVGSCYRVVMAIGGIEGAYQLRGGGAATAKLIAPTTNLNGSMGILAYFVGSIILNIKLYVTYSA